MKKLGLFLLLLFNLQAIELHQELPKIEIDSWSSNSLKGRVVVLFYVDPDEKEMNSKFSDLIQKQNYNKKDFVKVAVINLNATWKPNFVIEKLLSSKKKEFPNDIYILDKKSVLVEKWNLKDDSFDVLIFSKEGKLLFYKDKAMSDEDTQKALEVIETRL